MDKPTIMIKMNQFFDLIASQKGAPFVSFHATTVPRMNKTGNPFYDKLFKISHVNGALGRTYENAVNNQRDREGIEEEFIPEPRTWGIRVNRFFSVHVPKGEMEPKLYLTVAHNASLEPPKFVMMSNNEVVPNELVEPFLAKSKQASTQGTEKRIWHQEYCTISFDEITIEGIVYILQHDSSWKKIIAERFPMVISKYPEAIWGFPIFTE